MPAGKGAEIAGTLRVERKAGEVTVSVVAGDVQVADLAFFSGGHVLREKAKQGSLNITLKL